MKKIAFYGRYSSANQTEQSIEGQLHVCEQYAAAHDLQIVRQYVDRAISGKSDNRPQFQQMIADSTSGIFEGILVYKLDRFARNRYDSFIYKHKLKEQGIRVISATEPLSDTPEGIIFEALIEGMDEYYSAELGRKMKRGKKESVLKGRFIGQHPPFGYKVVDHRLAIDDLTAPIAQEIFLRYAAGEKQNRIITDLNERGIHNAAGGQWNKVNLTMMLRNRIYIGIYSVADYGESACPALIDKDVFDTVQKMKAESLHKARASRTGFEYVLTGHMVCAQCGGSIVGHSMQHKYHYYQCHRHCGNRIRAEKLHDRVKFTVAEYLTNEKMQMLARGAYDVYLKEKDLDERPLYEQELASIEKQLQNAVQAILRGVDLDTLNDKVEQLKVRREELRRLIEDAPTPMPKLTYETFLAMLNLIVEKAAATDDLAKLCNTVVNKIIIDNQDVLICINLTNESNEPPMEQIKFKVKDDSIVLPIYKHNHFNDNHTVSQYTICIACAVISSV